MQMLKAIVEWTIPISGISYASWLNESGEMPFLQVLPNGPVKCHAYSWQCFHTKKII